MSRKITQLWISYSLSFAMALLALALPIPARAENVENISIPITILQFVSCADGGAGEFIEVSGDLHIVVNFTIDKNGGVHGKTHFQPQGISGVGLTTGDKYQATGVTQNQFNSHVGFEETYVNNFRMIGQGPRNNLLVHVTSHITINANGDVTAFVDNVSEECR